MFLKASCSMKFRLGSLWKALKIEKATFGDFAKIGAMLEIKQKKKSNFGILKLCGHVTSSKLSQGKCFRFNRVRNGETGRKGALRLLSLSKISILILNESKNAEMLKSSLFFGINK